MQEISDTTTGIIYLDHNATTPVDPRVADEVVKFMLLEYGNAGSRTHTFGQMAKDRVQRARTEIAELLACDPAEVIFTSGATESNNLATLGLAAHGEATGRKHIVSTLIEHKAVLEPLAELEKKGFEVELVAPDPGGWVDPDDAIRRLRPDTLLVSMMAVNNETGVIQPIEQVADALRGTDTFFHVDAAQAYGKLIEPLRHERVDLLSFSGHKIGAPKGIGGLLTRRRGYKRPPLTPLMYGGGQERGLRPGTLPVALIAGLGLASSLAVKESSERHARARETRDLLLKALTPLNPQFNGDLDRTIDSTLNFSIPGVDSEAAIVALKDIVAISNGSACTAQTYEPSHVLLASGIGDERVAGALRLSWGYDQILPDIDELVSRLRSLSSN
ncbi:aminotransferase class V-fold PLP-dependent enzyme [Microbacterium invictum]|uniref:cysteine desulfurase n=1 Tax=Microbacterium invictum TaxID=515415 RepID=A0AA40SQE7_9MICO|nr:MULTISPECIES: aminotransferase class V-fold PLP-dependent enzyme [Microbacterium]MBB4140424.1 cysteine desulfurase [Microbacterium invictum]